MDESLEDFIGKIGVFGLEMLMIILNMFVILGITEIFVLFASIAAGIIDSKNSAIILILIMAVIIIVAALIGKHQHSKLCKRVKPMAVVFCEGVLIIMLVTLLAKDANAVQRCLYVLIGVSTLFSAAMIVTFYMCGIYKNYKHPILIITRAIRYILLIRYNIYFFIKLQVIENITLWPCIYIILCCFEYLWIEINNDKNVVKVIIHSKNGDKETKNKIIQYEENKIGYKLLDGKEEIVDNEEIEMISYQRKHLIFKGYKERSRVVCKLRSGEILQYRGYRLIRDSWVELFSTEGGIKEVLIIKTRDTEKIIEEKNSNSWDKIKILARKEY